MHYLVLALGVFTNLLVWVCWNFPKEAISLALENKMHAGLFFQRASASFIEFNTKQNRIEIFQFFCSFDRNNFITQIGRMTSACIVEGNLIAVSQNHGYALYLLMAKLIHNCNLDCAT